LNFHSLPMSGNVDIFTADSGMGKNMGGGGR
jgi:hypothetical protein